MGIVAKYTSVIKSLKTVDFSGIQYNNLCNYGILKIKARETDSKGMY